MAVMAIILVECKEMAIDLYSTAAFAIFLPTDPPETGRKSTIIF
jgi:hypothetical protein